MDATLIILGSGCLVCLMPVAIYLLYLAHLNGRVPPTLVSGAWDFAALLLGLSGFLLLAGPLCITIVDSVWRGYAFGGWAGLKAVGRGEAIAGSLMASGYLLALLGVIPLLIRGRRRVTAVYNVAPSSIEPGLTAVAEELGYGWRQVPGAIELTASRVMEPGKPTARMSYPSTARVRIDPFPAVGHATLKWDGDWEGGVRTDLESALPKALRPHAMSRNPVAGWMFTGAVAVLLVMLLWLVVLIYLVMTPPPG